MSLLQVTRKTYMHLRHASTHKNKTSPAVKHAWWRSLLLFLLLLLSVALYSQLFKSVPPPSALPIQFTDVWLLNTLPYLAACALVLLTKPLTGRGYWLELGLIFVGALIFRAMLLPLSPVTSPDAWRYLWDARVFLHGYSPYVTVPNSPLLMPLRDALYQRMAYQEVPTLYPPVAQYIYALSYLLAPANLIFLKALFLLFDMANCAVLALLLVRKQLDPRRIIIYAWCPLVIVEFAVQGHVDVAMITFVLLAILCANSTRRGSRVLTGLFIAMATLIKIYPILMLIAVVRRRDWALLATCFATIVLGYLPFLILGQGQIFGFFSTYASQQSGSAGIVQLQTYKIALGLGYSLADAVRLEYIVDLVFMGSVSLAVLFMRLLKNISPEAATLVLIGAVFSVSSHILPWYTSALLPFVVLLLVPLWTRNGLSGKALAVGTAWYFANTTPFQYLYPDGRNWGWYYLFVYDVVMLGLGIALLIGLWQELKNMYRLTLKGKQRGFAKNE